MEFKNKITGKLWVLKKIIIIEKELYFLIIGLTFENKEIWDIITLGDLKEFYDYIDCKEA